GPRHRRGARAPRRRGVRPVGDPDRTAARHPCRYGARGDARRRDARDRLSTARPSVQCSELPAPGSACYGRSMRATLRLVLVATVTFGSVATGHGAMLVGPSPYLKQADSPFVPGGTFQVETFEDNALNTTGVVASTGSVAGPSGITDSVDADDGTIDGSG